MDIPSKQEMEDGIRDGIRRFEQIVIDVIMPLYDTTDHLRYGGFYSATVMFLNMTFNNTIEAVKHTAQMLDEPELNNENVFNLNIN